MVVVLMEMVVVSDKDDGDDDGSVDDGKDGGSK